MCFWAAFDPLIDSGATKGGSRNVKSTLASCSSFAGAVGDIGSPLQQEFLDLSDALARNRTGETLAHRRRFVSGLRRLLANACLDAMEPDLVILDEFQRFRELLNPDTESGELAQRLFEYEDSHTKVRTNAAFGNALHDVHRKPRSG